MPEEDNKKSAAKRIPDSQRFKYIGFEVFPGKPKDLFKSDAEKSKFVDAVIAKRAKGEVIREECILLEERVTTRDRVVLAIASLVILVTLFIPWYSAYNEVVEETEVPAATEMRFDSIGAATTEGDSVFMATEENLDTTTLIAADEPTEAGGSSEEVIHGMKARKRIYREYSRLSGLGAFLALGNLGSQVFSSGFILVLTAIILMLYTILCIALPVYTLYGLFGVKGKADERALRLKKILRYNWVPLVLIVFTIIISFVGAKYSFDPAMFYSSLSTGYGIGVLLNSLSWGIFVSLCAFILVAVKGIEI